MDNKFCADCGSTLSENAAFCASCGSQVNAFVDSEEDASLPDGEGGNQPEPETKSAGSSKKKKITAWIITIVVLLILASIFLGEEETDGSSIASKDSSTSQNQPVKTESVAPVIFSDEQASSFLLRPDDFPKKWTAKKNGMVLEAQNDYMTDFNVKMIEITLATQETEAAARAAFSAKKSEAQTTIDGRGISGDKLEDVKKYPLFVWNASQQANISGVEKWTVIGVYGNITVKVYHEGSMGAPNKGFAVDIAKKQIDRIKGD